MMGILRSTGFREYYGRLRVHTEQSALWATNANTCAVLIGDTRLPPRNMLVTDARDRLHTAVFAALRRIPLRHRPRRNYVRDRLPSVRRRAEPQVASALQWARWGVSCGDSHSIVSNVRYRIREAFPRRSVHA